MYIQISKVKELLRREAEIMDMTHKLLYEAMEGLEDLKNKNLAAQIEVAKMETSLTSQDD